MPTPVDLSELRRRVPNRMAMICLLPSELDTLIGIAEAAKRIEQSFPMVMDDWNEYYGGAIALREAVKGVK